MSDSQHIQIIPITQRILWHSAFIYCSLICIHVLFSDEFVDEASLVYLLLFAMLDKIRPVTASILDYLDFYV